jgi:hypothetical protein
MNDTKHGEKTMTTTKIASGIYFLHPAGSCWIAARFQGGRCVDTASQSDQGTHEAANDSWAGVAPSVNDEALLNPLADQIIREVMGDDVAAPAQVVVTRAE